MRRGSRYLPAVKTSLFVILLALAGLLGPASALAQLRPIDSRRILLTRGEIEELVASLEQSASSPQYSGAVRAQARAEAELLRERLTNGDFQVGDRVWLYVEQEPELTDTFTVNLAGRLPLPNVGEVPLHGILRSELESHLADYLNRFIRLPVVRAQSLMRVTILGAVPNPGFYTVPSTTLITDVVTQAGGLGQNADLEQLRIERNGEPLWDGVGLQNAVAEGRTLDQMSIRAGDQIVVPERGGGALNVVQAIAAIMTVPVTIITLITLF